MATTEELIDTLSKGDMVQASNAFTDLMQSRVQNALDDRKVEIGQQMHLSPEEIEQIHAEEDEDDSEETLALSSPPPPSTRSRCNCLVISDMSMRLLPTYLV